MLIDTLKQFFARDLNKLKAEIEQYKVEQHIWVVDKDVSNSAGNLCLHLIGNLNHFIGKELGGTDYVRDRPLEFSQKDIPVVDLSKMISDTLSVVEQSLDKLTVADLAKDYPLIVLDQKMTTEFFLIHLATHLSYHLGQINYHRRMLDS